MKVLLINGSPHKKGNTYIALSEVATALEKEGVATEIVSIGTKAIQGCIACNKCQETGVCVFNDEPYRTIREKLQQTDGVIIGSPVYFAGPNGMLCALLDRLFYSCRSALRLQTSHFCRHLQTRRGKCDFRPPEQVFHDNEYASRFIAILEQCTWTPSRRGSSRLGGVTNHADVREKHGLAIEKYTSERFASSRTGTDNTNRFYSLKGYPAKAK